MDEAKWMTFINHLWAAVFYWELIKQYRKHELSGPFFSLSALATRNEFLMRIAHAVHLCREIAKEYDVGEQARRTLDKIVSLFGICLAHGSALERREGGGKWGAAASDD